MPKSLLVLALFLSLNPAFAADEAVMTSPDRVEEMCLISNLRFDQDMRLYDFWVIEPDFSFVTDIVGYQRVNGELRPLIDKDQDYRMNEKGYGLKTVYKTDQTLSQTRVENQIVFAGLRKARSYVDSWELTIDYDRRPRKLKRVVTLKPSGATRSFVCDKGLRTSPYQWFSAPFHDQIVEYNIIRAIPTIEPAK